PLPIGPRPHFACKASPPLLCGLWNASVQGRDLGDDSSAIGATQQYRLVIGNTACCARTGAHAEVGAARLEHASPLLYRRVDETQRRLAREQTWHGIRDVHGVSAA